MSIKSAWVTAKDASDRQSQHKRHGTSSESYIQPSLVTLLPYSTMWSSLILLLPLVSAQGCPMAGMDKRDLLGQRADPSSLDTLSSSFGKCSRISDAAGGGSRTRDMFPCQLKLDVLRQFSPEQNPLGKNFDYAAAFAKLDCKLPRPPSLSLSLSGHLVSQSLSIKIL